MKAFIYSDMQLIGETELIPGDISMGCVYGNFEPNEYYIFTVQKKVQELNSNLKADDLAWQQLKLSIQLENGYFLHPVGGCMINDLQELPDEPIRIDIMGLDHQIITDYFTSQPPMEANAAD